MLLSPVVVMPSAARADPTLPGEFYGTAYYLGQGPHPTAGPCWDGGGSMAYQRPLETDPGSPFPNDRTTWGTFTQPYYYESRYIGHSWRGDLSVYRYEDHGFATGYRQAWCVNSSYVYRYWGRDKIGRDTEQHFECIPDFLTCLFRGWHPEPWHSGWSSDGSGAHFDRAGDYDPYSSSGVAEDHVAQSGGCSCGGGGSGGGSSTWSGRRNDLNGDGKADLLALTTSNELLWYPGKGDGSFWSSRSHGPAGFLLMAKADLNGDGKADLLALTTGYELLWYPGKGDGSFWSSRSHGPAGFRQMALADLNGDGKADLLALTTGYQLLWYPGKGDGSFWSSRDLGPAGFSLMSLADLNGDGKADLLALTTSNELLWYPGKGDGSFWSSRSIGPAGFNLMSLADLNGDGKADLLALYTDYTLHWYPGKGDGSFWSARDLGPAGFSLMTL
jgi:hypothetical protein